MTSLTAVLAALLVMTSCLEAACPDKCTCLQAVTACIGLNLTSLPRNIPKHTKELYLNGNNFAAGLPLDAFENLEQLETLALANCRIENLASIFLASLKSLKSLDLHLNKLKRLDNKFFRGLKRLEELNLDHNDLRQLKANVFSGLNLTSLSLEDSKQLSHIHAHAFQNARVRKLYISNSSLDEASVTSLRMLKNSLRELRLQHNKKPLNLTAATLSGMKFDSLNFDANGITDASFLENVTALDLSLEQNAIGPLDFRPYAGLRDLRTLRLYNTRHKIVRADHYAGMERLAELYLAHNGIRRLDISLRPVVRRLNTLLIDHNPLHCNCEMRWLKQLMTSQLRPHVYGRCKTPRSERLNDVTEDEMQCQKATITEVTHTINKDNVATLKCTAEGDPAPEITWYLPDGDHIEMPAPGNVTARQNSATISLVATPGVAGKYKCAAVNSAGEDERGLDIGLQSDASRAAAVWRMLFTTLCLGVLLTRIS